MSQSTTKQTQRHVRPAKTGRVDRGAGIQGEGGGAGRVVGAGSGGGGGGELVGKGTGDEGAGII